MLWVNVLQVQLLSYMGGRFLFFRESFPSWNPLDPFTTPCTILLADLQEWQSLLHIKELLTSLRLFCQSISSHHRPVSYLALGWSILLHDLLFFHALSCFPDPSLFSKSLFFLFLSPWSPQRTVGPPAYHTYLCTRKKLHIHSHPFFWLLKQITRSQCIWLFLGPEVVLKKSQKHVCHFLGRSSACVYFPKLWQSWFSWSCPIAQVEISKLLFIPKKKRRVRLLECYSK